MKAYYLWFLLLSTACNTKEVDDEAFISSDTEYLKDEEMNVDPHAEMEKGDFADEDYPDHEPIFQPFEQDYEKDQADLAERQRPNNSDTKEDSDRQSLPNVEDIFIDNFKKPELQLEGMADHEPIYQPEDPGDSAEASPDYKGLADNEYQGSAGDASLNEVDDIVIADDKVEEVYREEDNHEPIYQPADQEINEIYGHDEL